MNIPGQPELTARQQQILRLLKEGKVNKEVARELDIGLGTVKQHIVAIFKKLKVRNRTAAVSRNRDLQEANLPTAAPLAPKILLTARPCVVLSIALPADAESVAVRKLYSHMATLSSAQDAIFLTRQGNAGEIIFGVQKVTEYDVALALQLATGILNAIVLNHPGLDGRVRGCLTAGVGFASMQRFGGWSGEAIASAAISTARELLQATSEGMFVCDSAAQELCSTFGIAGSARLSSPLPFKVLPSLQWSGMRTSHPLVGRTQELKLLHSAVSRATRGHGSIVVVEGEMGMGKTRICQDAVDAVSSQALQVHFFQCLPNLLGAGMLGVSEGRVLSAEDCLSKVTESDFGQGHVVIIDDFHLIEGKQQAAWFGLSTVGRTKGLLTIFAGRRGLSEAAPLGSMHILLGRLPLRHMQALVRQALPMPAGKKRTALAQAIIETSTGVPLFALEMARQPDPVKLSLPLMVTVQSRLDKLRLDSAILRLVASTQGGISLAALAAALGESVDALALQVNRAAAAGVLTQNPAGHLNFTHPMIRRVIANSIMD